MEIFVIHSVPSCARVLRYISPLKHMRGVENEANWTYHFNFY